MLEGLDEALRTLRKHHHRLVVLEELDAVLRCSDHRAGAVHEGAEEGELGEVVLGHPPHQAGRLRLQQHRHGEHGSVVGEGVASVIADQQHAAFGYTSDAMGLDAEPVAVEDRREQSELARVLRLRAERIEAVVVQPRGDPGDSLVELGAKVGEGDLRPGSTARPASGHLAGRQIQVFPAHPSSARRKARSSDQARVAATAS